MADSSDDFRMSSHVHQMVVSSIAECHAAGMVENRKSQIKTKVSHACMYTFLDDAMAQDDDCLVWSGGLFKENACKSHAPRYL